MNKYILQAEGKHSVVFIHVKSLKLQKRYGYFLKFHLMFPTGLYIHVHYIEKYSTLVIWLFLFTGCSLRIFIATHYWNSCLSSNRLSFPRHRSRCGTAPRASRDAGASTGSSKPIQEPDRTTKGERNTHTPANTHTHAHVPMHTNMNKIK